MEYKIGKIEGMFGQEGHKFILTREDDSLIYWAYEVNDYVKFHIHIAQKFGLNPNSVLWRKSMFFYKRVF